MQRRVAVEGDVSQLVAGNVIHEAPASVQQNNNVTYNLHTKVDPLYLHIRQRQRISKAVDKVAKAAGIERLDVYQVLLDNHAARSMKTMPADKYRAIMDDLSAWLKEAGSPEQAANDEESGDAETRREFFGPAVFSWRYLFHVLISATAFSMSAVLVWEHHHAEDKVPPNVCLFNGKHYSIGSVTAMPPGGNFECVGAVGVGGDPRWAMAKNQGSASKRKS